MVSGGSSGWRPAGLVVMAAALMLLPPATAFARCGDTDARVVRIGALAKCGREEALRCWRPTAKALTRRIEGACFKVVPLDFDALPPAVGDARVDFVLANPAIYVRLEHDFGVRRIATLRKRVGDRLYDRFGGVILTRADNDAVRTLADLRGRAFAAVHETSLGGWLMALGVLRRNGIAPRDAFADLRFAGTHNAVVKAILRGDVAAGTARTDTVEHMAANGAIDPQRLRVVHPADHPDFALRVSTPLYPEWPMAALDHVDNSLVHRVATTLMALPERTGEGPGDWTVPRNYQGVRTLLRRLDKPPYTPAPATAANLVRRYGPWVAGALVVLLGLAAGLTVAWRLNVRLRQRERELHAARQALETRVAERTAELKEAQRIGQLGNWIWDVPTGALSWSDEIFRIFGVAPSAFEATYEAFLGFVHPDDRQYVQDSVARALRGEAPYDIHHRIVRPDGGERIVHERADVTRDEAGNPVRMTGVVQDVTERRRVEDALRESEERYRSITDDVLDNAAVGLFILDTSFHVVWVNRAVEHYTGLDRDAVLGADKRRLLDTWVRHIVEDGDAFVRRLKGAYDSNDTAETLECHILPGPGRDERWLEHRSLPIRSGLYAGGRVEHYHDITERKRLEVALRRANRDLEEFAYTASHNMGEPLRMVTTQLQLLDRRHREGLSDDAREALDIALAGVRRMGALARALLAYSRIAVEGGPFHPVALDGVFDDAVEALADTIAAEGAEVTAGRPLPRVQGDRAQLFQLLRHLLGNAVRYRRDAVPPRVRVWAGPLPGRPDWTRVNVEDNGRGIDPDDLDRLFDIFRRPDLHAEEAEGAGIGLALCKRIVERHGGRITATRADPEGSVFSFTLPVAE